MVCLSPAQKTNRFLPTFMVPAAQHGRETVTQRFICCRADCERRGCASIDLNICWHCNIEPFSFVFLTTYTQYFSLKIVAYTRSENMPHGFMVAPLNQPASVKHFENACAKTFVTEIIPKSTHYCAPKSEHCITRLCAEAIFYTRQSDFNLLSFKCFGKWAWQSQCNGFQQYQICCLLRTNRSPYTLANEH